MKCCVGRVIRITHDADFLHVAETGEPRERHERVAQPVLSIKNLDLNIRKSQVLYERLEKFRSSLPSTRS